MSLQNKHWNSGNVTLSSEQFWKNKPLVIQLTLNINEVEGAALERKVNRKVNALYGKEKLFHFQILLCFSFQFGRGLCSLTISKGDFWPMDSTLHVVIPDSFVSCGKDRVSLGTGRKRLSGTLST